MHLIATRIAATRLIRCHSWRPVRRLCFIKHTPHRWLTFAKRATSETQRDRTTVAATWQVASGEGIYGQIMGDQTRGGISDSDAENIAAGKGNRQSVDGRNQQTYVTVGSDDLRSIGDRLLKIELRQERFQDRFEDLIRNLTESSNQRGRQSDELERRMKTMEHELSELSSRVSASMFMPTPLSANRQVILAIFLTFVITVAFFSVYGQLFTR